MTGFVHSGVYDLPDKNLARYLAGRTSLKVVFRLKMPFAPGSSASEFRDLRNGLLFRILSWGDQIYLNCSPLSREKSYFWDECWSAG